MEVESKLRELERRSLEAGQPVTVQRRAALEALVRRTDHPTADAVYADVIRSIRGISKATVYRALDHLVSLGLARRVDHGGSRARFDGNVSQHGHLICESCDAIVDVDADGLESIPWPSPPQSFFEVRDVLVTFRGVCRECAARDEQTGRGGRK